MTQPSSNDPAYASSTAEELFYTADLCIEQGKVAEAHQALNALVERFPDFGRAYNHLGFLYETKFRDLKKAEHYYRKAIELSPDYTATWLNFAVLLSQQERWKELTDILEKSLTVPGINKAKVLHEKAIMHEAQDHLDEAILLYRGAIAASFSEEDIGRYQKSVDRCLKKEAFLK